MPRPMRAKTRRSFKGEGSTTGKNQPNYMPLNRAIDRVIREREASGDLYPRKGSFEDQQRYRLDSQDIAREKGYFVPFMPKREVTSIEYEQGGEVKGNGPSIKIPGQYAYEPIATTESGEQYVTMELPDGTMATVFGDWETYGNPSQEGYIEDIDYRIIPRGDGSYELDAGEMESEMLRDESRELARDTQGGPGASRMQDLLEKLSDRPGMGMTPEGRMRPIKRQ